MKEEGFKLRYGSIGLQKFYAGNFADVLFYMCSYFYKNMPGKFRTLVSKFPNCFVTIPKNEKRDRLLPNNISLEISKKINFNEFLKILGDFCKVVDMNPASYLSLYFRDFDLNFKMLLKALEELQNITGVNTSEYVQIVENERRIFEENRNKNKASKEKVIEKSIELPEILKKNEIVELPKAKIVIEKEIPEKVIPAPKKVIPAPKPVVKEQPEELIKKYDDFDDFAPVTDCVYLKSNKSYYLKSFSFKDNSVPSKTLNYAVYTLFYIISKKKPDLIKHWASKKLNGLSLTKPENCKFSRKLLNDCWFTIPSFSMSNYKSLMTVAIKTLKAEFSDLSFCFTNKIKKDEKEEKDNFSSKSTIKKGNSKLLANNEISKSTLNSAKSTKEVKSEKKSEDKPNELKISYKYIDSIILDNGKVCLANNKDFEMKSFWFKDFKYDTDSLESVIYFLMYLLSKKEPGFIRYWAMKNRYGIGLNKASDQSIISKKLSNGCWLSFYNRSIEYYKELLEALRGKLNIKFESILYFVFREKENVSLDKEDISKKVAPKSKDKILSDNDEIKLMDKAEFFASEFIISK